MKRCENDKQKSSKTLTFSALEETLKLIKLGKGKGELKKLLNISPSALSNRLKRLEELGCINLIGKYEIEITGSSPNHPRVTKTLIDKKLNKRGHAYGTSIIFSQKNDLWNNKKILKEFQDDRIKKYDYGSYKLDYKNFTIIINKEDFTIFSKKQGSYFSEDALESQFFALKDLDYLARYLKGRYDLKGIYGLRVFREHYGIIFNKFATWVLGQRKKLNIKDEGSISIIWVDDSKDDDIGLKELESKDPVKANTMDEWGKDMDEEGWPLVSKIKKRIDQQEGVIGKSMEVLEGYAEQIALHLRVEQAQEEHLKNQTKLFEEIRDLLKNGR